ncbi:hypothetical protein L1887_59474 [Cichorium endivia]|nr:hypothetical protein L1887_59474 [Cichorium endivia]
MALSVAALICAAAEHRARQEARRMVVERMVAAQRSNQPQRPWRDWAVQQQFHAQELCTFLGPRLVRAEGPIPPRTHASCSSCKRGKRKKKKNKSRGSVLEQPSSPPLKPTCKSKRSMPMECRCTRLGDTR